MMKITNTVAEQTLAEVKQKITDLQRQAEAARAEEVAGVVGRIREAIAYYDLSAKDIFGGRAPGAGRSNAKKPARGAAAKKAGVIRYRDSAGNEWTGRGKRPHWFKAAIADGATPEDLAV